MSRRGTGTNIICDPSGVPKPGDVRKEVLEGRYGRDFRRDPRGAPAAPREELRARGGGRDRPHLRRVRAEGGKVTRRKYGERKAELEAFIKSRFPGGRYTIAKLDDYFGPGIASRDVQALVASPETGKRVGLANALRAERGFPPLELVLVDWVEAEDGRPISSTRIRKGEIDEEGRLVGRRAG